MLTARQMAGLVPGEHIIVPGAPGLRLTATASTKAWAYRYKAPDGRMRQIKLGAWPAMGLPAAMAAWHAAKTARDAGADPAAEKRAKRQQAQAEATPAYTVRRACNDYLRDYASQVTPKTYAEADRLLAAHLGLIEALPLDAVTRAAAFDTLDAMRGTPVLAQRVRQLMGAVVDRALDAGRVDPNTPNWWRLIMRGKLVSRGKVIGGQHQGQPIKRALSEAELRLLLPWLPNFSRDVEDALRVILWTACRGAEVLAMCAEEISTEPDGVWWTVPRSKLKMRRHPLLTDLRVPLVGDALAVVQRRLQAHPRGWL